MVRQGARLGHLRVIGELLGARVGGSGVDTAIFALRRSLLAEESGGAGGLRHGGWFVGCGDRRMGLRLGRG